MGSYLVVDSKAAKKPSQPYSGELTQPLSPIYLTSNYPLQMPKLLEEKITVKTETIQKVDLQKMTKAELTVECVKAHLTRSGALRKNSVRG